MDAFALSARISAYISEKNPRIRYFSSDVESAKRAYTADELDEMRKIGLISEDFETYYVIREFLDVCGVFDEADGNYLLSLFREAKRLDAQEFRRNPYLSLISISDVRRGNIFLSTSEYRRGEIFLYDMPDFSSPILVPKLGFFDRTVRFPTIYEGDTPWMSVCPSEIYSMQDAIVAAHGRVLVLGLGLGYYPFMIAEKASVSEIMIVELQREVIDVFERTILPQFPHKEKIRVVQADAVKYMDSVRSGQYDFCFADIWESVVDGAEPYRMIKFHESRLPNTVFSYWIEPQIKAYLDD